jgi:hypothetical protein
MSKVQDLIDKLEALKADEVKFYDKEQKAAGTRLRKGLSEVGKDCSALRKEIQERKNSGKVALTEPVNEGEVIDTVGPPADDIDKFIPKDSNFKTAEIPSEVQNSL